MGHFHTLLRTLWFLLMMAVIAGCRTTQPASAPTPAQRQGIVQWDRSPSTIIFRADVVGGPDQFTRLGEVPLCTIYGDNRVVWVNELDAFHVEILYDTLSDATIESFIAYLTVQERIYTHQALASEEAPQDSAPVVETVTINVNQQEHTADAFSGWDSDWFSRVLRSCQQLSQTPILFLPDALWLSVVEVGYTIAAPVAEWNAAETGLSLAEIASGTQPRWITGPGVRILWDYVNTLPSSLLLSENGHYYQVALQVPGISRTSPPAH